MANIKKSFNFRNGVQVDDDNLKVSATGLVGIGTTVPTEALDVRGNAVVSGVTSAVTLQAGVATITTLNSTVVTLKHLWMLRTTSGFSILHPRSLNGLNSQIPMEMEPTSMPIISHSIMETTTMIAMRKHILTAVSQENESLRWMDR